MPRRPWKMTKCKECKGHGWLLCTLREHPLHIEIQRCDACARFEDDNQATKFVAKLAWKERP